MRQIILDTETTGLEAPRTIGSSRSAVSNSSAAAPPAGTFHQYLNPERDIDEGALAVHGIDRARLERSQVRADRRAADRVPARARELIIHNAAFDVASWMRNSRACPGSR